MESQSDGVESEQLSEAFHCCVCLDLLYKPVVLACGHISCFWCVCKSMSGLRESHCPICRHPYRHFPTVCQMLHFLLLKMYPVAYKRRENQILEEEKDTGFFSPTFDEFLCASHTNEELNDLDYRAQSSSSNQENFSTNLPSLRKREPRANTEQPESVTFIRDNSPTVPKQISTESFESTCTVGVKEKSLAQRSCSGICRQVSIVDVLCPACKQLLFRPAVLNCGHVYCETCIIPADEGIRCQICQSPHPRGLPKVCLEFDHFLEEQFLKEYATRRGMVQLKQVQFQHECPLSGSMEAGEQDVPFSLPTEENSLHWWGDHGSKVHIGVGCDSCGMFPIIGDRYRCKDCKEAIGFDLCGDCYDTRLKLPGRFNQQHTPDHRFEIVNLNPLYNLSLRLLRRRLEDGSHLPMLSNDASEIPENLFLFWTSSDNAQDNAEDGLVAPSTSSDTEEPQNDDTQPTP